LHRYALIVNPLTLVKHKKRFAVLCDTLDRAQVSYEIFESVDAASITALTREALQRGFTRILPVGGDGTLSLAVRGFMSGDKNEFPKAVIIPLDFGTGHDFYNGFIPKACHGRFDWAVTPGAVESLSVSLGWFNSTRYTSENAAPGGGQSLGLRNVERYFINSLSFGISSKIVEHRALSSLRHGKISYFVATIKTLFSYRNKALVLSLDGAPQKKPTLLFMMCKGPLVGGGMRLVAHANPLAATCQGLWVPALPWWKIVLNLPKIYQGRVAAVEGVQSFEFKSLRLRFEGAAALEADGELCEVGEEIEVRILPACVRFLRPKV